MKPRRAVSQRRADRLRRCRVPRVGSDARQAAIAERTGPALLQLADDLHVVLQLDVRARPERDRRREQARGEAPVSSPRQWRARANMAGRFKSASSPQNPDSPWFFSERDGQSLRSLPWGRATGPLPLRRDGGGGSSFTCNLGTPAHRLAALASKNKSLA